MARRLLKGVAWLLGAVVVLLAAWFGVNATDQELSAEARAVLDMRRLPAPDRDNGWLDHLVLAAPADVPTFEAALERLKAINGNGPEPSWGYFKADLRLRKCTFGAEGGSGEARGCFDLATREPWVPAALDAHATVVKRHRAMREKPRFISLFEVKSPEDGLPAFQELLEADRVILLGAARRFSAGERLAAARELEREAVFYRRVARDAVGVIDKFIAFAALDRVALFAAELARHAPRSDTAFWRSLESVLAPLTKEELDMAPAHLREVANQAEWMRTRRYVRLSNAIWYNLEQWSGRKRPWWDPVAPYLYRPHQTVNWHVARCRIFIAVGERPSAEFFAAVEQARERVRALGQGPVERVVLNPAGWNHPLLDGCEDAAYVARAHARAGVQTLARLQVTLRAKGITKPEEVAAALSGPLGMAHPAPFTGRPIRFDAQTGTIGFDAEEMQLSGVARMLHDRYKRMALPL